MARIIRDVVCVDLVKRKKILFNAFFSAFPTATPVTISRHVLMCQKCGRQTTMVYTREVMGNEGEIHEIMVPSTRIVLGIHPEINKEQAELPPDASGGESRYFCIQCRLVWDIPEQMAKVVPEVEEGIKLGRNPIIDSGRMLKRGKGCWVTITELRFDKGGRHINYQTDLDDYRRILEATQFASKPPFFQVGV